MRVAAIACILAGCGFDAGDPGDVDAGETIDAGDPDGGMADGDGDGIADAADNCPAAANPDQADYDLDLRGDACDGCPHLARADELDGDGDGVGDECDPRPQQGGDARALWTPFLDAAAIGGWTVVGTWDVSGGALRQLDAGLSQGYVMAPVAVPRAYAATRITIAALGTAMPPYYPGFGISTGNVIGEQFYACTITTTNYVSATSRWGGMAEDIETTTGSGSYTVGAVVSLVQHSTTDNTCIATQNDVADTATNSVGPSTAGEVILYSRVAAGAFDYLFVVAIGA